MSHRKLHRAGFYERDVSIHKKDLQNKKIAKTRKLQKLVHSPLDKQPFFVGILRDKKLLVLVSAVTRHISDLQKRPTQQVEMPLDKHTAQTFLVTQNAASFTECRIAQVSLRDMTHSCTVQKFVFLSHRIPHLPNRCA